MIELIDDDTLADEIEQADGYKSVFNALIEIERITKAPPTRSSPNEKLHPLRGKPCPMTPVRAAYDFQSFNYVPSVAT